MKKTLFATYLCFSIVSYAQIPTGTDIWLLDMDSNNGVFSFKNPINITNKEGYDNQPTFSPDSKYILYSAIHGDTQADIYKYDIASKTTSQLTFSVESEFSPTFMPDAKRISSVLIEKDSVQRLWSFSLEGKDPQIIMANVDSVGYHCWINKDSLVLFILTKPFSLEAVNIKKQVPKIIATNIGRAIQKREKHILFTQEIDSVKWICSVDHKGNISKIINCFKGSEDITLLNNGTLIMANGSKLFKFDESKDKEWIEVGDLSSTGITKITRIAISPDQKRIAVVDNK